MKKITVPTLASASPEHAGWLAKRIELRQEQSKLQDAITKSSDEMIRKIQTGVNAKANDRVLVLVGEKDEVDNSSDKQRHTALCQKLNDVISALAVVEDRLGTSRAKASRIICKKLEPEYKAIVADIADKLITLDAAAKNYDDFKNTLDAEDVSFSYLYPMPIQFRNRIAPWLAEAAANGFIKASAIPVELRQ